MKCIYAILNLSTDKLYVGSSNNIYKRWHVHKSNLKNNKHENSYLQRAWNKYGELDFILVVLEVTEDLEKREQFWIDLTKCYDRSIGYNSRLQATNNTGVKFSEETKLKISNTKKGKKWSDETRQTMKNVGRHRDKNKWPCELGSRCKCEKCKILHRERNKKHSQEWRETNREKYNEYMRNYNSNYQLQVK